MLGPALSVLVLSVLCGRAPGAEFTAQVVKSEGADRVVTGRIHVKGSVYRLEFPDPAGPTVVSIADPTADLVRVLVPRYKLYLETEGSGGLARSNDPFLMIPMLKEHYETKDAGKETVGRYECTKQTIGRGDQLVATVWTSTKLGFVLKMVLHQQKDYFTELLDVKEEAVSDDLLAVPEGYTKSDRKAIREKILADPEMKAKQEAWEKSRPRKLEVSERLTAGGEVNLLLGDVTRVDAGLKHDAPECKWFLEAFAGEKPLLPRATEPHVGKMEVKLPDGALPDRLVARCLEGEGYLGVRLVGKLPLVLAKRIRYRQPERGGRSWQPSTGCRKLVVSFTAGETKVTGTFRYQKGPNGKLGREERKIELDPGASVRFDFTAEDQITSCDVMIRSGGEVGVEVLEDMRPPEAQKPF